MGKQGPIPRKAREAVMARSGGMCEHCGKKRATQIHHRRYRSRGGDHRLSNLLAVCGSGNHSGCHGVAHTLAGFSLGLAIPAGGGEYMVPENTPFWSQGKWLLIDNSGDKREYNAKER